MTRTDLAILAVLVLPPLLFLLTGAVTVDLPGGARRWTLERFGMITSVMPAWRSWRISNSTIGMSPSGIKGFGKILDVVEQTAPLRRNVTIDDVGNVAAFMLSDLAAGVTGEIHFVDAGYNKIGMPPTADLKGWVPPDTDNGEG